MTETIAGNRRPVSEIAERFLRAIVDELTIERVVELHLFSALRQGLHETRIAVVALWPEGVEARETVVESGESDSTRHTVCTARYRQTIKGPDRGRWEFECVEEADAPLLTVEMVVRGVLRRSGDLDEPVRYDRTDLMYVLGLGEAEIESETEIAADATAGITEAE